MDDSVRQTLLKERRVTPGGGHDSFSPMVGIAVAWVIGITTGVVFESPHPCIETVNISLVFITITFSLIMSFRSWRRTTRTLIILGTFMVGRFHAHNSCHSVSKEQVDVASFDDFRIVHVEGCVSGEPKMSSDSHGVLGSNPMRGVMKTIPLELVTMIDPITKRIVRCSRMDLKVSINADDLIGVMVGDTCHARARVVGPGRIRNPGCENRFPTEPFLMVEHHSLLNVERSTQRVQNDWLTQLRNAWRNVVSDALDSSMIGFTDPEERDLIKAIVLGDRNDNFKSLSQPYKRTGTAHYLAVSGFAIGVFSSLPALFMRGQGRFLKGFTVITFIVLGLLAIDLRSPAIRSGAVIMMAMLGLTMGREWSKIGLLALTSIAMLAVNPRDVLNPGFQLTFIVVASLMILSPRMMSFIPLTEGGGIMSRTCNSLFMRKSISCGVVAWLTSTPLIIHHFGIVCPIGILASIVLLPFMSIMIIASVAAIITDLITPSISFIPGSMSGFSMKIIDFLVHFFDSIPGSFYLVPEWSLLMTMAAELVIWRFFLHKSTVERLILIVVTIIIFGIHFLNEKNGEDIDDHVRIVTMDVGNGTCHLIMTARSCFLFDGGSLERRSCGRRIILPVLEHYGVERLDGIFISHANIDHFSGLPEVVSRVPVDMLLIGSSFIEDSKRFPEGPSGIMMKTIKEWRVPWKVVHKGMRFTSGNTIFEIHNPIPDVLNAEENDNSLVMSIKRVIDDRIVHCSLFTGDIEDHSMRSIVDDMDGIENPFFLEAPHHGSVQRESAEFISEVNPSIIIQSTGSMRMRRDELSKIVREHPGMRIYSTAVHGAIQVDFHDTGRVEVTTQYSDHHWVSNMTTP